MRRNGVHVCQGTEQYFGKYLRISTPVKHLPPENKIGDSLFDKAGSEKVLALVEKAKKNNVKLVFPIDFVTADKFDKDAKVQWISMPCVGACSN